MSDLDETLVAAARGGDRSAFETLVALHARAAGRLAERLVRSREDAEDVVQEAFVRAFTHLPGFRADATFKTWLYRIVFSVAQDHVRRRGRAPVSEAERIDVGSLAGRDSAEDSHDHRDRIEQLRRAIDALPVKQKAALLLKVYEGLSHHEVARSIGSTAGAARVYLALARQSLRRRFAAWFEAGDSESRTTPRDEEDSR